MEQDILDIKLVLAYLIRKEHEPLTPAGKMVIQNAVDRLELDTLNY